MAKQKHGMCGKKNAYKGGASTGGKSISFPLTVINKVNAYRKRTKQTFSAVVCEALEFFFANRK